MGSAVAMLAVTLGAAPAAAQSGAPTCNGLPATIVGTNGDDVIVGTKGNDVIVAFDGDDIVRGGSGDDVICGGDGADTLTGDRGHDVLLGEKGQDHLDGSRGQDELYGGNGADILIGGNGADQIWGNRGADFLNGNRGADVLRGGQQADVIRGGLQSDTIIGGDGVDACEGESESTCESDEIVAPPDPDPVGPTPPTPLVNGPNVGCNQAELVAHYEAQVGNQSQSSLGEVRAELLALVNETRSFCGLNALESFTFAQDNAQEYADQQRAEQDQWLTTGVVDGRFVRDGFDVFNRPFVYFGDPSNGVMNLFPWFAHGENWTEIIGVGNNVTAGENLGFHTGTSDVTQIHLQLLESGGHLCNIVSPRFDVIGIGAQTVTDSFATSGDGLLIVEQFGGDGSPSTTSVATFTAEDDFGNPNNPIRHDCF